MLLRRDLGASRKNKQVNIPKAVAIPEVKRNKYGRDRNYAFCVIEEDNKGCCIGKRDRAV